MNDLFESVRFNTKHQVQNAKGKLRAVCCCCSNANIYSPQDHIAKHKRQYLSYLINQYSSNRLNGIGKGNTNTAKVKTKNDNTTWLTPKIPTYYLDTNLDKYLRVVGTYLEKGLAEIWISTVKRPINRQIERRKYASNLVWKWFCFQQFKRVKRYRPSHAQ